MEFKSTQYTFFKLACSSVKLPQLQFVAIHRIEIFVSIQLLTTGADTQELCRNLDAGFEARSDNVKESLPEKRPIGT